MVVVTELLAGAIIEELIGTAYDYIADKVKDRVNRSSMNGDVDKLKKALPKIQAVLSATEKSDVTIDEMDPGLTAWMWQLRDAVDAANNLLDDIEYQKLDKEFELDDETNRLAEVQRGSESVFKGVKRCCTALISNFPMKKMKRALIDDPILVRLREVVKQLDEVAARSGEFVQLVAHLEQRASRDEKNAEISRDRETGFLPIEKYLFGREKEKEELTKWLLSSRSDAESKSESSVSVLSIVGVGGIGKTSLAQDIYNEGNVSKYFSKRIWVCVSNKFDVPTILGKIVESSEQSLSKLQEKVMTMLSPERFLLVLDDMWDDESRGRWENLVAPLQCGKSGSKIILTTRMGSVAKMARDVMEGSEHLRRNLYGLDNEMRANLLDKHAFAGVNRANYSHLQPLIKEIAKKLGGVPLLLKAVGGVLNSDLHYRHWINVLENNAMNFEMNENKVVSVLKLSYQNLPIQLRSCFRFCSIFPEDYEYSKEELVGMWVALGMIPQSQNGRERPEDLGAEFFNILVRKSFLEEIGSMHRKRYVMHDSMHRKRYVMHDSMHRMATIVSKGECLRPNNVNLIEIPETIRHLFIDELNDVSILAHMCPPKNLQTLILVNRNTDQELPPTLNKFFKRLTNLRVLKLHWSEMRDLSVANADLHHLRYIDIESSSDSLHRAPNCFRKLYHLQVIYLRLPDIENAFASREVIYSELTTHGAFFKLRKLRHFYIGDIFEKWSPVFFPGIGRLTSLHEIGTFTVRDEDGYKLSELKNMNNLNSSLKITGLEMVRNYEEAREARLNDKQRLCSLKLKWTSNGSSLGDYRSSESDAQLSNFLEPPCNLNELTIKGYEGLRSPCWLENGYPKCLVSLSFIDCSGMSQLPHLGCFCFIKFLALENLPLLKQMPPVPLSLEKLEINCVGLVSLPSLWLDSTSSIVSASLTSLVIKGCPNLRSLAEGLLQQQNQLTALKELEITECKELVRFPDVGLTGLTSLKSLKLQCNQSPEIIPSMPDNLLSPSLMELCVIGQVEGMLPNLLRGLSSLEYLYLIELNVTSLSKEDLHGPTSLEHLKIHGCAELASLDFMAALKTVSQLKINQCPKLLVRALEEPINNVGQRSSTDEENTLSVIDIDVDCASLLLLPPLRNLTSVQYLSMDGDSLLHPLLELFLLQNRTSLIALHLADCTSLETLPACLQGLTMLNNLIIFGARKLHSLPELPGSLEGLLIEGCTSELERSYRKNTGENWPKIAYIRTVRIISAETYSE